MAANVTDVLSLADAKLNLRVDGDDLDSLVTEAITSAVGYIQRQTGVPLLDRPETFKLQRPSKDDDPLVLPARDVKEVTEVDYWTEAQELRQDPAGAVAVATLGRREEVGRVTVVWPPADGWPEVLDQSLMQVTVTLGYDLLEKKDRDIKNTVIVLTRHFFEQPDRIESDFAVISMIESIKRRRMAELV